MDKVDINKKIDQLLQAVKFWLKRYPFHNIVILMFLAPVGYLFPLLFPMLGYLSVSGMFSAVSMAPALGWPAVLDWWPVLLWLLAGILFLFLSYRLLSIRPREPLGLAISEALAPQLFALIDELQVIRGQMPIHRIIVTDRFELDIVKTRSFLLPVWSWNTLVIGLPLIQMMPPNVFRAMMGRKICQHSLLRNPLLHWLHQLNAAWRQYYACVADSRAVDMRFQAFFYGAYSMLYAKLVEPVARLDGLSADSYTLKVVNDEDIVESIEYLFVAGMFIEKMFWPKLREVARKQRNYELFPFATLAKVGFSSLAKLDINGWLKKEMTTGSSPRWGVASMPVRMGGLGHDEIYELEIASESAAEFYFGQSLVKVVATIDRYWQKHTIPQWQALDDKERRENALMATLTAKFKSRDYSFSELRQYVRLAWKLRLRPALKLLFKMFFLTRIRLFRKPAVATAA